MMLPSVDVFGCFRSRAARRKYQRLVPMMQPEKCDYDLQRYCAVPAYLGDDLRDNQLARMLRSSTASQLQRPQSVTAFASRAFTIAAPVVWNSLSVSTRSSDSLMF